MGRHFVWEHKFFGDTFVCCTCPRLPVHRSIPTYMRFCAYLPCCQLYTFVQAPLSQFINGRLNANVPNLSDYVCVSLHRRVQVLKVPCRHANTSKSSFGLEMYKKAQAAKQHPGKLRQHSEYDCSVYEIGRLERWATLVLFAALASQVRVVLALALPF